MMIKWFITYPFDGAVYPNEKECPSPAYLVPTGDNGEPLDVTILSLRDGKLVEDEKLKAIRDEKNKAREQAEIELVKKLESIKNLEIDKLGSFEELKAAVKDLRDVLIKKSEPTDAITSKI